MRNSSAYPSRNLGPGERWGVEIQKENEDRRQEIARLSDESRLSAARSSAITTQISDMLFELGQAVTDIQRLSDKLSEVEDMARQSALDIRALRNELETEDA